MCVRVRSSVRTRTDSAQPCCLSERQRTDANGCSKSTSWGSLVRAQYRPSLREAWYPLDFGFLLRWCLSSDPDDFGLAPGESAGQFDVTSSPELCRVEPRLDRGMAEVGGDRLRVDAGCDQEARESAGIREADRIEIRSAPRCQARFAGGRGARCEPRDARPPCHSGDRDGPNRVGLAADPSRRARALPRGAEAGGARGAQAPGTSWSQARSLAGGGCAHPQRVRERARPRRDRATTQRRRVRTSQGGRQWWPSTVRAVLVRSSPSTLAKASKTRVDG